MKVEPMASDSKGLNRLKAFAKEIPDERETVALLRELEQRQRDHSGDRAAAILGGTIIENALRVTLLARFRPDKEGHPSLFDGDRNAPLSTFAARIRLGYALRIFGPKTLSDLQCIKAVRNAFAHSLMTFDFAAPEIATVCDALVLWAKSTPIAGGGGASSAKEKYIRSASYITGALKRIALMSTKDIQSGRHLVWPESTELW
jgi:hypothetical protein